MFILNEGHHKERKRQGKKTFSPPKVNTIYTVEQLKGMPVACSISTEHINDLNSQQLSDYAEKSNNAPLPKGFVCRRRDIKNMMAHGVFRNTLAKAAMCCVNQIISNGYPLSDWGHKDDAITAMDKMPSLLFGAKINIDGKDYICKLTLKFNPTENWISPYALMIYDGEEKKVANDINVIGNDSINPTKGTSAFTNAITSRDDSTPSKANVNQNSIKNKENHDGGDGNPPPSSNQNESIRRITQSDICRIVESVVREVLDRQQLNEIYFHEPRVEKRIGEYEVVDGNLWDGKVEGILDMGWVQDVRLYSSKKSNGKTFALYKKVSNGKFFFVDVVPDENDPKKSKAVKIKVSDVPEIIVSDGLSLVRRDRKGLNLFS